MTAQTDVLTDALADGQAGGQASEQAGGQVGEQACAQKDVQADALENKTFKEGLDELEQIVRSLESNQLELEESIKGYEHGVALLGALKKRLDDAQQKVTCCMGELEPESSDDIDTQLS